MRKTAIAITVVLVLSSAANSARGGAVLLKENVDPSGLTAVGPLLYFNRDWHGLWQSDGTSEGTFRFTDLEPLRGRYGYLRGVTYFPGRTESCSDNCNFELYRSDGTPSGTFPLTVAGPVIPYPEELAVMKDNLYVMGGGLWRTDGTANGTVLVVSGNLLKNAFYLIAAQDQLFFSASDGVHGHELWRSDGTESGTFMVRDIRKGSEGGAQFKPITAIGNQAYFVADDGIHGLELWRSDGTKSGTDMIKDICPGPCDGYGDTWRNPGLVVPLGESIYFSAYDGVHGYELWKSDGTAGGTRMVKDVYPGPNGVGAQGLTALNGALYFGAYDEVHGYELWRSNGSKEGTYIMKNIGPGGRDGGSFGDNATVGDVIYFRADDGIHGSEVWRTDGTEKGTYLAADIWPGSHDSYPEEFTAQCGKLYFNAQGPTRLKNLYRFDRYPDGFVDVKASGRDGFSVYEKQADGDLVITAAVKPRQAKGTAVDWWLRATAPGGAHLWYTRAGDWIRSVVPVRAHAGPLRDVGPKIVLSTEKIPQGRWQFDLAVDQMDGIPQWSACDTVGVLVEP